MMDGLWDCCMQKEGRLGHETFGALPVASADGPDGPRGEPTPFRILFAYCWVSFCLRLAFLTGNEIITEMYISSPDSALVKT